MRKCALAGITLVLLAVPALSQTTGWIGVRIEDHTERGAIVRGVEADSPAAKAGLREGDVIVEFNRQEVIGVQQLTRIVRETPAGRTVDVKVRRENQDQTFQMTIEAAPFGGREILRLPDSSVLRDRVQRSIPRIEIDPRVLIRINSGFTQFGVRIEPLTDQLRDFFGVFSNAGVLVSSVDQGSAGEKAGLKAGDVITSVNGRIVRNPSEFSEEVRASRTGSIALKIFREKQERDVTLEGAAR